MRVGRHRSLLGGVAMGLTAWAASARAAATESADVDDPKMARVYEAPAAGATSTAAVAPSRTDPPPPPPPPPPPRSAPSPSPPPVVPSKVVSAHPEPPRASPVPKPEGPKPVAQNAQAAVSTAPKTPEARPGAPGAPAPKPMAENPPVPEVVPRKLDRAPAPPPTIARAERPAPVAAPPPAPAKDTEKPAAPAVDVAARPPAEKAVEPPSRDRAWPYAPRLKLAYRRFAFARVASSSTPATSAPASESFESVSLDLYPMSWFLRVGLSTQFGWESEKFDRSGDYFIAETASVGFQWPGRFTPFVEALAGAGYMRRASADWNLPTAFWQVGVDAGVEIYVANRAYVSLAVGYLHPGNLFVMQSSLMSVKTDTWSLKFGVGI